MNLRKRKINNISYKLRRAKKHINYNDSLYSDSEYESEYEQYPNYNSDNDIDCENINYESVNKKSYNNLSSNQKKKIIDIERKIKNELNNVNKISNKYKIMLANTSIKNKCIIIEKINQFNEMNSDNTEYHKLKQWIDGISRVPFGTYISLNINMTKYDKFLCNVYDKMDKCIYGQNNAKNKIMQIVAKWISNPSAKGNVLGFCGKKGVGKTSLAKNGIAKALERPIGFITLGGAKDVSFLEGHDYTYVGGNCSQIINILKDSKCMNPILFFDELDKIGKRSDKGCSEIESKLIHLTDVTQNDEYHDNYYDRIDFNISKSLFIFSYNDEEEINKTLMDRIDPIYFDSYSQKDKLTIAKDYLVPAICKEVGIESKYVSISDKVMEYIIKKYSKEEGVRTLKKVLETIYMKINLLKYLPSESQKKINMPYKINKFKLPIIVTSKIVNNLVISV